MSAILLDCCCLTFEGEWVRLRMKPVVDRGVRTGERLPTSLRRAVSLLAVSNQTSERIKLLRISLWWQDREKERKKERKREMTDSVSVGLNWCRVEFISNSKQQMCVWTTSAVICLSGEDSEWILKPKSTTFPYKCASCHEWLISTAVCTKGKLALHQMKKVLQNTFATPSYFLFSFAQISQQIF